MYGEFDADSASSDNESEPYTPTSLGIELNKTLAKKFRQISLKGEVSSFTISRNGHAYFTLVDKLPIECAMWRNRLQCSRVLNPDVTSRVISVKGDVKVGKYDNRLRCEVFDATLDEDVRAQWYQTLQSWETMLRDEGLLDVSRHRTIPRALKKIAIITSDTGAVIHDMRHVLDQSPLKNLLMFELYPCAVQGDACVTSITNQLDIIEHNSQSSEYPDCIAIVRGGGSDEDLKEYHNIDLCRRVASFQNNTSIPVICAIGHAEDRVLLDQVVDVCCVTPTAAAHVFVENGRRLLCNVVHRASIKLEQRPLKMLQRALKLWCRRVHREARIMAWMKSYAHSQKCRIYTTVFDRLLSMVKTRQRKKDLLRKFSLTKYKRILMQGFTTFQVHARRSKTTQQVVARLYRRVYTHMLRKSIARWTQSSRIVHEPSRACTVTQEDGSVFDPDDASSRGSFMLHSTSGEKYKVWYTKIRKVES